MKDEREKRRKQVTEERRKERKKIKAKLSLCLTN
jgi:hypothetical protein